MHLNKQLLFHIFPMRFIALLSLLTSAITLSGESVFTVEGRQILLNGEPFRVQGVCYGPVPIGSTGSESPFGDYFTTLFLSATGPDNEAMRRMGANVQRGYGWAVGGNHTSYLDRAYNNGENPLYVFVNRWINPDTNWGNAAAINAIVNEWVAVAEETKDHPGIIGYLLGNEHNAHAGNGSDILFWEAMETIAAAVKEVAPNKLVSIPITDAINQVTAFDETVPTIDFWAIQIYRSTTFGTFFEEYKPASSKPVVLTEYGYDAYDNLAQNEYPDNAAFTADVVEGMIGEINGNSDVCAGGMVFSFKDEWWKAEGSLNTQDSGGIPAAGMPDRLLNEEWWGIFKAEDNGFLPDLLTPRALYYRLISLWNPLPELDATVTLEDPNLVIEFERDVDDRDFHYAVEISNDLQNWTAIADNEDSEGLEVNEGAVITVTENEVEGVIQVRIEDANFTGRNSGTFLRAGIGQRQNQPEG